MSMGNTPCGLAAPETELCAPDRRVGSVSAKGALPSKVRCTCAIPDRGRIPGQKSGRRERRPPRAETEGSGEVKTVSKRLHVCAETEHLEYLGMNVCQPFVYYYSGQNIITVLHGPSETQPFSIRELL